MELAVAAHYRFGLVRALVSAGHLTLLSGSARQAASAFRNAAGLARELDERVYLAAALTGLGDALGRLHEDGDAERALTEALELCEFLRADVGIVNAAQQLGDLHRSRKRPAEAKAAFTRALEAARRSGTVIGEVNARDGLGEASLGLKDIEAARQHYLGAYDRSVERGYRRGEAWALFGLGRCGYALDLPEEAYQLFESALEVNRELGDLPSSATALDGMARAAAAMGDVAAETRARVDAVLAIEAMRSSQDRHQYQQEYRERFAAVYSAAIRAAVRNSDPAAFITVFENLAGRRLAGLVEKIPATAAVTDAQLASQVLATASNLPLDGGDLPASTAGAERRARLIGRLALRGGMPETAERAIADIAAALYRSFSPDDAGPLLDRAPVHSDLLLVTLVPGAENQVARPPRRAARRRRAAGAQADHRHDRRAGGLRWRGRAASPGTARCGKRARGSAAGRGVRGARRGGAAAHRAARWPVGAALAGRPGERGVPRRAVHARGRAVAHARGTRPPLRGSGLAAHGRASSGAARR